MIHKPLEKIDRADIEGIVKDGVREGRTIEYKQGLPGNKDSDKKEFLADISSFANASGGIILFGISEKRDSQGHTTGIPDKVVGLGAVNLDVETRRMEDLIRNGISPRLSRIHTRSIDGFEGGPVIAVRIQKSLNNPHMVTYQGSSRFYSRTSAGKYPLDIGEIRAAFLSSEDIPDRIRRFREERVANILASETPIPVSNGPTLIYHLIPVQSVNSTARYSMDELLINSEEFWALSAEGMTSRFNMDGILRYSSVVSKQGDATYIQIFRNAILEIVDTPLLRKGWRNHVIPANKLEIELVRATTKYLSFFKALQIDTPIVLLLTLTNVKGMTIKLESARFFAPDECNDKNLIALPDVVIDDLDTDVPRVLRPIFDELWQACGYARSMNYDEKGNWLLKRG